MKYQNLIAFEKHLEQAAKVHLSRVFLIVASCPYERKKIVDKVVSAIESREGDIDLQIVDSTQEEMEERIESLNTVSLLTGKPILYLNGIDKLKKNTFTLLAQYVENPSPFAYLVLGAQSSKGLAELYSKGKKEMISCDLSEEKPWDRKDRLKRTLIGFLVKAGKKMHGEALDYLLENIGLSLSALETEVEKLINYTEGRSEVTLQDVQRLCMTQKSMNLWQLAEAIVWHDALPRLEGSLDLSGLLPLIAQLRLQLQQGLCLSLLMERKSPLTEFAHHFPQVKPTAVEKMLPVCKRRPSSFFKRSLDLLFDIELMAKNSSFEPMLILDLFLTKITLLKRHYAVSFAQSSR